MAHVLDVTCNGAETGISVPSPATACGKTWLEDFITWNGSRSKKEKG